MSVTSNQIITAILTSINTALTKTDLQNDERASLINQYEQTTEMVREGYQFSEADIYDLPAQISALADEALANSIANIQSQVDTQIQTLQDWKTIFLTDKEYLKDTHVSDNLIENPLFILNGEKSLHGWSSAGAGITMEVVHPYTRGFSSPYISTKSDNHVDTKTEATETNPYWAGAYKAFGGAINFGSISKYSLLSGWDYVIGNILKISYDGSASSSNKIYFKTLNQYFGMSKKLKFSAFVFVEEGVFFMGDHAGYNGLQNSSKLIEPINDWEYFEMIDLVGNAASGNHSNEHCFGFNKDIPSTVYIAIPNLVLMNNGDGKIISMKKA